MKILKYIIIGFVQGITELLPVSSSGHVIFYSYIFKLEPDLLTTFLIITNFGSFLALFIHYSKDIFALVSSLLKFGFNKELRNDEKVKDDMSYILKIIIAVIPIGLIGFFFRKLIPNNLLVVGISFIITSILLIVLYIIRDRIIEKELTYQKSLYYGLMHMVAVLPGVSRSGVGLFGGIVQGVEIKKTIRFTFLIYLVISIPVTIIGGYDFIKSGVSIDFWYAFVAFITSFLSSFLFINLIYKVITFNNFKYFSVYVFLMGIISIVLYII